MNLFTKISNNKLRSYIKASYFFIAQISVRFSLQGPYFIENTAITPDITGRGLKMIMECLWSCMSTLLVLFLYVTYKIFLHSYKIFLHSDLSIGQNLSRRLYISYYISTILLLQLPKGNSYSYLCTCIS